MRSRPLIWFFRATEAEDAYRTVFEPAGFETRHIPVLRFDYASDWDPLPDVDAAVVTSPRAAEALVRVATNRRVESPLFPPRARNLPWYPIGPSTAAALRPLGIPVEDTGARTAEELARRMPFGKGGRVAFYAGEPHRAELADALAMRGMDVATRIVYRSRPALDTSLAVGAPPDWAVFFSPRGVEIVALAPGPDWNRVRVAAIGPTTAEAVRRFGFELAATAGNPDPAALLRAIERAAPSTGPARADDDPTPRPSTRPSSRPATSE